MVTGETMNDQLLIALHKAIDRFMWQGPGSVETWEPGEDVDNDELAGDVIQAAMLLRVRDFLA